VTFEVVTLVMNACLCVVFVCATVMAVFLLYAGTAIYLKSSSIMNNQLETISMIPNEDNL
jgi:hypothetical protein